MIINEVLNLLHQPNKYGCFAFTRPSEQATWVAFNGHLLKAAGCTAERGGSSWRSPTSSYLVLVDEATLIIDRKRLEGYRFDRVWVRGDIHADVLQMLRMKERLWT